MKRRLLFFVLPALTVLSLFTGCTKDDALIYVEGGTPPALTISNAAPVLDPARETETAMTFSWTNPDYKFTTGISSQDVQYNVEIDTVGSNFSNPKKGNLQISNDLTRTLTVYDLNQILSGANFMGLTPDRDYNLEARVISSLGKAKGAALTSNVVKFTARPYSPPPAVVPPTTGRLFAIGDATPGGWPNPVPADQEFTKVANAKHKYELVIKLNGGKTILMLPKNGDWGDKYGWDGANNANFPEGDVLKRGGGDIKVPAATGMYKIVADFQVGKFTITPQ